MKKGIFLTAFTLLLFLPLAALMAQAPGESVVLTEKSVVDILLQNSFGLKQAESIRDMAAQSVPKAKSVFDTNLSMDGSYQLDKSKRTSPIFGDRTDTWQWDLSLSKQVPTGTVLGFGFYNTRSETFGSSVGKTRIIPQEPLYNPNLGFSIQQPLMQNSFGMNSRRGVEEARLLYKSAEMSLKREVDLFVYQGLMDYWSLVFIRKHIEAQERAVKIARDFLTTTKEERRIGTAEQTDLLAAEANLLNRIDELLSLQEQERTLEEKVRHSLELDPEVSLKTNLNWPGFENAGSYDDERLSEALSRRGDYQSVKSDLDRQNVKLAIAKNVRWPKLDLVSSLQLNDISQSYQTALGDMNSPNVTVGLNFSVPLENRAARAETKRTAADKARALYALKDLENQITNGLARLVSEVGSRRAIVENSLKAYDIQMMKLSEELKKYSLGRSSSYVVVQYQNDAVNADRGRTQAWFDYQNAVLELKLTESKLLE